MQHSFQIEEGLFRRLQDNAELGKLSLDQAVTEALKEYCENREYLRSEVGRKKFPAAARSLDRIEKDKGKGRNHDV